MPSDALSFAETMQRYMRLSSRLPGEVMRHKAVDLGFKLRAGFREHRWGKGDRTVAFAEFAKRSHLGKGIKLRNSLLGEYRSMQQSGKLSKNFRQFYRRYRRAGGGHLNVWQAMVARELRLRTVSIGSLAAMFAWSDRKNANLANMLGVTIAKGIRRTGPMGFLRLADDSATIVGFDDVGAGPRGIDNVDTRYGITRRAIEDLRAETISHLRKAHLEGYREIYKSDPK